MQTILCATDFSDAGQNAVLYASEMAKLSKAKLILVNSFELLPFVLPGPVILETIDDTSMLQMEQMDDCINLIDSQHLLQIEKRTISGPPVQSILKEIKESQPDIVICGMKGSGKGIRKVMGSVATGLAKKCEVPLLIVPENASYSTIEKIALATEHDLPEESDARFLNVLSDIVKLFNSRLILVRVADNITQAAYELLNKPYRLSSIAKDLHPEFTTATGNDLGVTLNEFAKKNGVNMMAILSHHYSFLQRLFIKSSTTSLIFTIEIPLLVIPYSE